MKKRMRQILAERAAAARDRPRPAARRPRAGRVAEPFEIGGLRLENRLVQAPLAGIANWAFRRQSRRHGAGLAVSEMIASFGIRYANRKTLGMLTRHARRAPGRGPGLRRRPRRDGRGGPRRRGRRRRPGRRQHGLPGAEDLQDRRRAPRCWPTPTAAARVVEAMVRAVDIPVTVKMRRGAHAEHRRARSRPRGASRPPARRPSACTRARPPRSTRAPPTTASPPRSWRRSAIPVIASGDVVDARGRAAGARGDRLRGGRRSGAAALGYPWAFGDILRGVPRPLAGARRGGRRDRPLRRRRAARPSATGARLRVHAQVLPLVPRGPRRPARRARGAPHRPRRSTGPSRGCGPSPAAPAAA